ncbi:MAG: nuclear transport factor 2 family protein [Rhodospirillaceae bacterium]|jgi:hypothetical protein|nr:nuclear transport factor 2 family protein [Rhodospirillaceae bacterium]
MANLETELQDLLSAFEERWSRRTPTALKELWDPNEAEPFYIAEEITDPMYGWETIEPYWQIAEDILLKFSIRTWNLKCKLLSEDLAALNYMMHWNGLIKGMEDSPLGLDVRVSAIVRRTDKGWRFCHYIESPLGAFPYLKAVYQANVDPGFMEN